jgi:hypothetical protein
MTFLRNVLGHRATGSRHRVQRGARDTMTVDVATAYPEDQLRRWEWAARAALAELGIGYDGATAALASVRRHCWATGQMPWEAYGPPRSFAATVVLGIPTQ